MGPEINRQRLGTEGPGRLEYNQEREGVSVHGTRQPASGGASGQLMGGGGAAGSWRGGKQAAGGGWASGQLVAYASMSSQPGLRVKGEKKTKVP